jgi:RNA polymerase sigma-70 factor (ECF subfamily)
VEQLFRHEAGRLTAALARILGDLDLAEECVQDALIRALELWPYQGVPQNPKAWLLRTAKNRAVDRLRRDRRLVWLGEGAEAQLEALGSVAAPELAAQDELLGLLFACGHPALPLEGALALMLKVVLGFSVSEISRVFLTRVPTIQQRIVRAKRRIRELGIRYEVPEGAELHQRKDSVLRAIYLLFSEGYAPGDSDRLLREDLCREALRLARALAETFPESADVHGALGLFHFQIARFAARLDVDGDLVRLQDQDRRLWSQEAIQLGIRHTAAGMSLEIGNAYVLEAAIAGCHMVASSDEETDWPQIERLYRLLLEQRRSPVVALNHAVAVARVHGPEVALQLVSKLAEGPELRRYALLYATLAELEARLGSRKEAAAACARALELTSNAVERRFLEGRLRAVEAAGL